MMPYRRLAWSLSVALWACGGEQFSSVETDAGLLSQDGGGGDPATGGTGSGGSAATGTGGSEAGSPGSGGISQGGSPQTGGGPQTGGTSQGGGAGVASIEELFTEVAQAYCTVLVRCCPLADIPLEASQCEENMRNLFFESYGAARPEYYTYDAAAGADCLARASAAFDTGCESLFDADLECGTVLRGTLGPGSPCMAAAECAGEPGDDVKCEAAGDAGMTCVVEHRAEVGESCEQTCTPLEGAQLCTGVTPDLVQYGQCFTEDGLYCSNNACTPLSSLGGPCTDEFGCTGQTTCNPSTRTCVALPGVGGPCAGNVNCGDGFYCNAGQCALDLAPGSPCTNDAECQGGLCTNAGLCSEASFGMGLACAVVSGQVNPTMP
jgi:hypothetical protein